MLQPGNHPFINFQIFEVNRWPIRVTATRWKRPYSTGNVRVTGIAHTEGQKTKCNCDLRYDPFGDYNFKYGSLMFKFN